MPAVPEGRDYRLDRTRRRNRRETATGKPRAAAKSIGEWLVVPRRSPLGTAAAQVTAMDGTLARDLWFSRSPSHRFAGSEMPCSTTVPAVASSWEPGAVTRMIG